MSEPIDRRLFVAGLAAAAIWPAAASALPVPKARRLAFDVVRKGKKIGWHRLSFDQADDETRVTVDVALRVALGPIPLFRYQHHAIELWRGDQFVSVEANTVQNGDKMRVVARRLPNGVSVDGPKGRFTSSADTLPATHWNRRMLEAPFLNTQTGEVQRPKVERRGWTTIPAANGGTLRAEHFVMSGEVDLETFYDEGPTWAGLRFKGGDGSTITYQRV
jgi:hypothetical protein